VTEEHRGQLCATGELVAQMEELQFILGEGPSVDASNLRQLVVAIDLAAIDLADPDAARWPVFAGAALRAGVRAILAFPLVLGAACIGVLTLYKRAPGGLSPDQHADTLVATEIMSQMILTMQVSAAPDELAAALTHAGSHRPEVHQAAGRQPRRPG
jgi:hypothetical protein